MDEGGKNEVNVHTYGVSAQGDSLNGIDYKLLTDMEMIDTLACDIFKRQLNNYKSILEKFNDANQKYIQNQIAIDRNEIERKTHDWRIKIDEYIHDLRRIRVYYTSLLLIDCMLRQYYHNNDETLWFVAKHGIHSKIARWVLKADAEFDESGLPLSNGAGKFASKFGFYPVIVPSISAAIFWQWNSQWNVLNMMQLAIVDPNKKYFHKMTQWIFYFKMLINIVHSMIEAWDATVLNNNTR